MSRSGYNDYDGDNSNIMLINWRGAVASAFRGARGQSFLREMRDALDALPVKRLIEGELETGGGVCAIGAVGVRRGTPMADIDMEDYETIAARFGIARAMAQEIMWYNDEYGSPRETPEDRFVRIRAWVEGQIKG